MTSKAHLGDNLPPMPALDFSKFGDVEVQKLPRIQALTGQYMHRNWLAIPHVTHHDQADITEAEADRKLAVAAGNSLSPLAYQVKAVVAALAELSLFNASYDADTHELIRKKYFNIGIAVDTPNGMLVPVIKQCDQKSLFEIAAEISTASRKARAGTLSLTEMSGSSFTISSLGGIGGTGFTPIINAPDVAILGVAKAQWQPRREAGELVWRLMLPLSLSYDHRVINGAYAARFTRLVDDKLAAPASLQ